MNSSNAATEPEVRVSPAARLHGFAAGDRIFKLLLSLAALDYAPLPKPVVALEAAKIKTLKANGKPIA